MDQTSLRRRTHDFFELGSFSSRTAAFFEYFMITLILMNVAAVALETEAGLWQRYSAWFHAFDLFSVGIFSIEYVLRVWSSAEREIVPGDSASARRLRYIFSPLAIIDLLAILPFYLGAFVAADLRALRIFRLVRLLKLVRYSPALSSLVRVLFAERRALFAALIIMAGLMFFSATAIYFIERTAQPEAFGSIPKSLWWALSTLTTVGYGDVVPITGYGQVVGGVVMIFGLAFYALPIGIIASGFSDEVHRREFVVPVRVIEDFPAFAGLPNDVAKELVGRLRSLVVSPGTVLTHNMDSNNGLYFIISGEVTAFFRQRALPLRSGDFFGECGMIADQGRQPAIVARSRTKVIWLESIELHMLAAIYPELMSNLRQGAEQRLVEFVEDGILSAEDHDEMIRRFDDWLL